jgi:acyl-CoA synthetase (NDP forming)
LAVLVTDACATESLAVTRVVDIGVDAPPERLRAAVVDAVIDTQVDAVVAVFVPPVQTTSGENYAVALREAGGEGPKPVLTTFLGFEGVPAALGPPGESRPTHESVPSYPTPERAVRALAQTVRYSRWRCRPASTVPTLEDLDADAARTLVEEVMAAAPSGRALDDAQLCQLLRCYGIATIPACTVRGAAEAEDAARDLGAPVAIKVPGAVRLHLSGRREIGEAWTSLALADDSSAVVQQMAPRGVDVIFGIQDDRSFGALLWFGVGGIATELLGDRAYAAVPLTVADAADLVAAPRAAPLLAGYRGRAPTDIGALTALALRLSALADDLPEVAELRLDAVAAPEGTFVLSGSARVAPPVARGDTGPRRLPGF